MESTVIERDSRRISRARFASQAAPSRSVFHYSVSVLLSQCLGGCRSVADRNVYAARDAGTNRVVGDATS